MIASLTKCLATLAAATFPFIPWWLKRRDNHFAVWVALTLAAPAIWLSVAALVDRFGITYPLPVTGLVEGLLIGGLLFTVTPPSNPGPDQDESPPPQKVVIDEAGRSSKTGESWLRLITTQMPSILWTTNRDLRITNVVGGGVAILHKPAEAYLGKTVAEVLEMDASELSAPVQMHQRALAGQSAMYEHVVNNRRFDVRVEPLRDGSGSIVGCVALAVDITERKKIEDALRRTQDELEQRVAARTVELLALNTRLRKEIEERKRTEARLSQNEARYRGIIESQQDLVVRVDAEGCFTFVNDAYCRKFGKTLDELIGTSWQPLVHPEDLPKTLEAMKGLEEPPHRISVEQRALTVDGWRWIAWEDSVIHDDHGLLVEIQAVGRDITERVQVEQDAREQRALAEALRDTAAVLSSTLKLDEVLDLILASVGRVVPHDAANIVFVEEGKASVARARGYEQYGVKDLVEAVTFQVEDLKLFQHMAQTGRPGFVENVSEFSDWVDLQGLHWVRSFAGAPIIIEDELIGFLNLDSAVPGTFSAKHIERLQVFADQAAIAIHNARLHKQAQELAAVEAAEEERQRIARELHDAVSQTLFSASVIAQTLPRLLDCNPAEVRRGLDELHKLTRGALAEMRSLLLELRPTDMDTVELDELLRQLIDAFTGKTQVSVSLKVRGNCSLAADVRVAMYRIAQEALNNIVKHARATHVEIELVGRPGYARLRIADNGRGFEPINVSADHFGLEIMKERAALAGLDLAIDSKRNHGTTIVVNWRGAEGEGE